MLPVIVGSFVGIYLTVGVVVVATVLIVGGRCSASGVWGGRSDVRIVEDEEEAEGLVDRDEAREGRGQGRLERGAFGRVVVPLAGDEEARAVSGQATKDCLTCGRPIFSVYQGTISVDRLARVDRIEPRGDVIAYCRCGRQVTWFRSKRVARALISAG